MVGLVRKFVYGFKKEGVKATFQRVLRTVNIKLSLLRDFEFDVKYGTDTRRWVKLEKLNIQSTNKDKGVEYQATREKAFTSLMKEIPLPAKENVFVDLGSGKGRALLMAASFSFFKKVVGIEFSGELCAIARKNIEIYRAKTGVTTPIEIIESDVVKYVFRNDENVFYMANPFNDLVIKELLVRMRESLGRHPRKILLIYNNPLFRETVAKCDYLHSVAEYHFLDSSIFLIYANSY